MGLNKNIKLVIIALVIELSLAACQSTGNNGNNPSPPNVWVRVNQAGYTPERKKSAVIFSDQEINGRSWNIKDGDNIVLSGTLSDGQTGDDYYLSEIFTSYIIDFTQIQTVGVYSLEVSGSEIQRIIIRENPYSPFATQALMHLRTVRSGINNRHMKDAQAIVYDVSGDWKNGAWKESAPRRTLDMLGGHYDAGDYIKFTLTEAYLAWYILSAYQENPSFFTTVNSTSGLPDVLDEAKYCLDYLAKTFPDENTFVIQVGDRRDHQQYPPRLPEKDALDGKRPALCALSRVHMGSAAAALALGAQVFKDIDAAAVLYENKAKAIYARARKNDTQKSAFERDEVNDFYYDEDDTDNMALAAAELYRLTQIKSYLTEGMSYAPKAGYEVSWMSWNSFANYRLAQSGDNTAKNRLLQEVKNYERDNIWGITGRYIWGSLHRWIEAGNAHLRFQRLNGSNELSVPFMGVLDYTFGRNNWGIAMIASQDLPYSVKNIYNYIYKLTGTFPAGALSEGPGDRKTHVAMRSYFNVPANSPFEIFNTPAGVFYDNSNDFMIQESTIGGQGSVILMLALASLY